MIPTRTYHFPLFLYGKDRHLWQISNFRCEDHNKIYKQLKSARVNTKHMTTYFCFYLAERWMKFQDIKVEIET